jgi:hypothetical protein
MEAVQYLCEFFFCQGLDSFFRLCIVGALFYCLSPKINNYNLNGSFDEQKDE